MVTNTKSDSSTGTIQAFSLTITGNVITTPTFVGDSIVNGASLAGGLIVPGEIASIYGYTLGPRTGVSSSGTPGTSLGGTTVTRVLSSAVGLFTNQSTGRGRVLAINQDGTVNSSSNPAAAGSYISLYADGLGAPSQSINASTPTPNSPLFSATGTVSVIIGGLTAPVQFADCRLGTLVWISSMYKSPRRPHQGSTGSSWFYRMVLAANRASISSSSKRLLYRFANSSAFRRSSPAPAVSPMDRFASARVR